MKPFGPYARASVLLVATVLNGCVVQSLNPFFTKDAVVPLAHLWDEWDRIDHSDGLPASARPWEIGKTEITTYDGDKPGPLKVTYFRVGQNTFVDATAGDLDSDSPCGNAWWSFNIRAVHTLARIIFAKDRLEVRPLDYDWLNREIDAERVNLPRTETGNDFVFTATPSEWMEFLKKHGSSTDAFPEKEALIFTRHPQEAPTDQKE